MQSKIYLVPRPDLQTNVESGSVNMELLDENLLAPEVGIVGKL